MARHTFWRLSPPENGESSTLALRVVSCECSDAVALGQGSVRDAVILGQGPVGGEVILVKRGSIRFYLRSCDVWILLRRMTMARHTFWRLSPPGNGEGSTLALRVVSYECSDAVALGQGLLSDAVTLGQCSVGGMVFLDQGPVRESVILVKRGSIRFYLRSCDVWILLRRMTMARHTFWRLSPPGNGEGSTLALRVVSYECSDAVALGQGLLSDAVTLGQCSVGGMVFLDQGPVRESVILVKRGSIRFYLRSCEVWILLRRMTFCGQFRYNFFASIELR